MIETLIENKHPIIIKHEKLKDSFPFPKKTNNPNRHDLASTNRVNFKTTVHCCLFNLADKLKCFITYR